MSSWHSYPKIYNLGHAAITQLFDGPVLVEEKIDGSQFSFGRFGDVLRVRSKGQEIVVDAPDSLFIQAVETAKELFPLLRDGWTYRGEYLKKPKHNALAYDRIPTKHIMLFDINTAPETYLGFYEKFEEARRLGLEVVPAIHYGVVDSVEMFRELIKRTSVLGGQQIEGVVVKNYARFGADGKVLMGKHVSEVFREVHKNDWKKENPNGKDKLEFLAEKYRSKARWSKAIQHLAERGALTNSPKDIGALIKEAQNDLAAECEAEIKQALYDWAKPHILRKAVAGLPEWYKERLLESQFVQES